MAAVRIPVDHKSGATEIETHGEETPRALTLMDLVDAVSEAAETEQEVLAAVTYMLKSGRVRPGAPADTVDLAS